MVPFSRVHRTPRGVIGLAALCVMTMIAGSCSIAVDEIAVTRLAGAPSSTAMTDTPTVDGLPVLGPVPASSHWHAAYVVRVCDDVLAPFDSADDPLGIHSHGDGLMHVHPFFEQSGYESATLGLFADAMGFAISEGELTLPGGGTWRDGDLCNGVPGRVFVDRWQLPDPDSAIERIFTEPQNIRYLADGELYQIAFAPADSSPVVPPAFASLGDVSNLAPPPEPWVGVDETTTLEQVQVWSIGEVGGEPCVDEQVLERVDSDSAVALCFAPAGSKIEGADAITSARAVIVNRQPAIDLRIGTALQQLISGHFEQSGDPFAFAIEVDGFVITAPRIVRPPASSDRLVVSGGFTAETATQLAAILNG